jgi:hypothetical protein
MNEGRQENLEVMNMRTATYWRPIILCRLIVDGLLTDPTCLKVDLLAATVESFNHPASMMDGGTYSFSPWVSASFKIAWTFSPRACMLW